jgi:3-oxoacyl-[acyl-carrier protein] reductase
MELGLKGKKALITGGATGIGRAIAVDLAKEGVQVVVTSRVKQDLESVLDEIGRHQGHMIVETDLVADDGPQALGKRVQKDFGDLDIVINNIGGTLGITDPLCPVSDWRRIFRLNFEVTIELNNFFLPMMIKKNWGRIVNISAGSAMENNGPVPYCTIKAALAAYSRSMGRVLAAQNVVMSSVLPGVVLTERGDWARNIKERPDHVEKYLKDRCPLGRFGQPHEISPMVVLLCSELASFCQGAIVPVDGGQCKHYYQVQGL